MCLPCDDEDRALFQASTELKLGNGRKASFWHDKWLNGIILKDQAPNLFKRACFKNRTVAKEHANKNWIVAVCHISSRQELVEFIEIWSLLKNVCLREEVSDSIIWKWTPSGEFSLLHPISRLPCSFSDWQALEGKSRIEGEIF
jgi:hypothetical protein